MGSGGLAPQPPEATPPEAKFFAVFDRAYTTAYFEFPPVT